MPSIDQPSRDSAQDHPLSGEHERDPVAPSAPPSPRKIRLLTAVLLVATFAAGTVTGAGLGRWISSSYGGAPPSLPAMGPPLLPLNELGLTEEQKQKVLDIFEQHRAELEAVLRDTYPKVHTINEKIAEEVRAVLTPEQRTKLAEIEAHRPPAFGRPPQGSLPGRDPPFRFPPFSPPPEPPSGQGPAPDTP
jgi:Spy/CpxP family protein refolding chaperone